MPVEPPASPGPARRTIVPGAGTGTGSPMLSGLLPPWAGCAEVRGEEAVVLFPEEADVVARARAGRRREFGTARLCARRALGALGLPASPLPRGPRGAPVWPEGVVGSITHCDGYRAAAVARDRDAVALGVDAEPDAPLSARALEAVASGEERRRLVEHRRCRPDVSWDRLLFSAKESVYKVWSPLVGRWLGFEDAEVRFDPPGEGSRGTFHATIPAAPTGIPLPRRLSGHWLSRDGLLVTAIAVCPPPPDRMERTP